MTEEKGGPQAAFSHCTHILTARRSDVARKKAFGPAPDMGSFSSPEAKWGTPAVKNNAFGPELDIAEMLSPNSAMFGHPWLLARVRPTAQHISIRESFR